MNLLEGGALGDPVLAGIPVTNPNNTTKGWGNPWGGRGGHALQAGTRTPTRTGPIVVFILFLGL